MIGNLTRDPELRHTPKGTAVARIGMAMNRTWKDANGQKQEEVTFVDVDAMGRQAEVIAQYMRKGRPIQIEGRLKLDQWQDKTTGQNRSQLRVFLEQFTFLGDGASNGASSAVQGSGGHTPSSSGGTGIDYGARNASGQASGEPFL